MSEVAIYRFHRKGERDVVSNERSPVPTPRYGQVLAASAEIARSMQHGYVGVEHLFLAIIRDQDAVPTQSLAQQIGLAEVEAHLLEIMHSPGYNGSSK
jgi:ATP-dependent Clp protease ATP-binding subunit ClpC